MLRLNESAKKFAASYQKALPHALLIVGQKGVGLRTYAEYLAKESGTILTFVVPAQKTSTSIPTINAERIRALYDETRVRLSGPHFVIIDDADAMNHTAQNALLKLLEEPNESIHFILTSHTPDLLLPTIRSRAQRFDLPAISELDSKKLLTALGVREELDIRRLLFVASGKPAELSRLSNDSKAFKDLSEHVATARQFIEGNTYQKMIVIQSLKDDRAGALKLIELILLLLRRNLSSSASTSTVSLIKNLVDSSEAIRANGNIRIHLMQAVVQ